MFKGNFWTLGLPREVGSTDWTSHTSDYGLVSYLPSCKVKFKLSEKPQVITSTLPHLWFFTQDNAMPILYVTGHDRTQGYWIFYPQNLVLNTTQEEIYEQQIFTTPLAVSCFWKTWAFLRFGKSVSCKAAQTRGQCDWEQKHWTGCHPVTLLFLKHSALVTLFITWCFRPYFFYITKTKTNKTNKKTQTLNTHKLGHTKASKKQIDLPSNG